MNRVKKQIGLIVVIFLAFGLLLSGCGKEKETVKESELTVLTAEAQVKSIAKTQEYSGTIRGINEVNVMAKVPARVTAILVEPGDYVTQGQTILTLDSSDYEAGIRQAEAAVAMAEAGQRANEVQKQTALANYNRMLKLSESGAISASQLEGAKAQYDALNAGSTEAAVEQANAALLQARNAVGNCTVSAPISGVAGAINLSLGETASVQTPAAIISDTSRLEIDIMVSEDDISYIQVGSEVDVLVRAVQDKPFKGRVESAAVAADSTTKSYLVKISLDNPNQVIKSGMFAQVSVNTESAQDTICVPRNAVIARGSKSVVFIVDKDKRAQMVEVTTGIENSSSIQILSGLKVGQQVIAKGNTLVSDGTLVRVVAGGEK